MPEFWPCAEDDRRLTDGLSETLPLLPMLVPYSLVFFTLIGLAIQAGRYKLLLKILYRLLPQVTRVAAVRFDGSL
jgi:hypothetical protein